MLRHNDPLLRDIVVERFTVSAANPNVGNPQGSQVIRIPHPTFDNRNGGTVAFGPDGMLFISTGDGGGGGDPQQNAQDTRRLLGKMLRLDVSVLPYRIPPTNPFAGLGLGEEIWARGLRNPGAGRSTRPRGASTSPTSARAASRRLTWLPPTRRT